MLPELLLKSFLIYLAMCVNYSLCVTSRSECEIWKQRQLYPNTALNVKNDTGPVASTQEIFF